MKNAEILFNKKDNDVLNIEIKGDLTIDNAGGIREKILENLGQYAKLEINICEITDFDLAFYQLLVSLQKSVSNASKEIKVKISLPSGIEELLKNSGINKHTI